MVNTLRNGDESSNSNMLTRISQSQCIFLHNTHWLLKKGDYLVVSRI